ncbi:MAG: glycosyltransferase family 39 protein [Anaerolineales bacterium]|nr:glycosyltransferase family 39 protein [Anaerolineales bacterium]MCW5855393.1 glycosyltransferase family 39 protein [Anaerolineales bacterium]
MKTLNKFLPRLPYAASLIALAAGLSWISSGFAHLSSLPSFLVLLTIAVGLFGLTWRILRPEQPPRWLAWLTGAAVLLRLLMGVVWLLALPAGGYDTDVQQAGYVMQDAFNRDQAAWQLAQSETPLVHAFQGYSHTDQYGGLLFLSAAVYRYLGGGEHQPLMVLVLAAAVSGLAVAYTWAFARRTLGPRVAHLAACGVALYPEAVLLGSSQMREAFTVCLLPLALYALLRCREKLSAANLALLLVPLGLTAALTSAFIPSLLGTLALVFLAIERWPWLRSRRVWLGVLAATGLGVLLFFLLFDESELWLVQAAQWQVYVSANASGWVAREFERLPLGAQIPFLVSYGVLRPLLPAALTAGGPLVWTMIGVWRALGWTVLLAFLLYAIYLVLRDRKWLEVPGALLLAVWATNILTSYRGGGDLWDNPRYRSAFASIQLILAAWAWVRSRERSDPWLHRSIGVAVCLLVWFIPWYLRRYADFEWPLVDLHQVAGVGLATAGLYILSDWMRSNASPSS